MNSHCLSLYLWSVCLAFYLFSYCCFTATYGKEKCMSLHHALLPNVNAYLFVPALKWHACKSGEPRMACLSFRFLLSLVFAQLSSFSTCHLCPVRITLSVTKSASANRSAFSSNSPARMRNSVQIDTPLSSRARALWRSFFLPFYRPTHSLCACLSACSDIYDMSHSIRTLLLFFKFFFRVLKG